jgi:hypothetical protein
MVHVGDENNVLLLELGIAAFENPHRVCRGRGVATRRVALEPASGSSRPLAATNRRQSGDRPGILLKRVWPLTSDDH